MTASRPVTPLQAWFTLQGDLVGVSGVPVRLVAGQAVDPTAWYSASGYRAAISGPFRPETMNKQGYLRGSQILAAEKLARAARHPGQASAPVVAGSSELLDWKRVAAGGTVATAQCAEWDLAAHQPTGVTPAWRAWQEEAGRPGKAGKVRFLLGGSRLNPVTGPAWLAPGNARQAQGRHNELPTTSLDVGVGVVERLGSLGLAISTVCVLVDAPAWRTTSSPGVLDIPALPVSPRAAGPLTTGPHRYCLEVAADHTRVPMPRRIAPSTLAERLRQTPLAAHNAVFGPAIR